MQTNKGKKVGAVLVVGGGVGGMQASLDLAEAGYKVYLAEHRPSIGGTMAQLDKTFPTNDCAMCTLGPRLVDTGAHLNIEKITNADIDAISGEPGNFEVVINKRERYVDLDKCTGCSLCQEKCPVKLDSEFNVDLIKRSAIYRRYPQAVPGAFAIDKQGVSPCRLACPAGVNAHAYVALIAQQRFAEALEIERQANPFPGTLGRICFHPCEQDCTRKEVDNSVAVCALKRFLADWEIAHPQEKAAPFEIKESKTEKVAIVGAGPAGLMAARELALNGYAVTIFEAEPKPGGMLRYGIPAYRLPKDVLDREIQTAVLDLGIELKTNSKLGKDFTLNGLTAQGYQAVFLAIGAWKGLKLNISGESDYPGVIDSIAFLKALNLGKPYDVSGRQVAVIGGGNSAVDAARSAWRLGAEVTIVYRRTRSEMPASPREIDEAVKEGINLSYLAAPAEIIGENGRMTGLKCIKMQLGEPDASGRRRPVPIEGSEYTIPVDFIIYAIGQSPHIDIPIAQSGLKINAKGVFDVDDMTLATNISGVFAGGDAVSGPASAIEAIAAGSRAAESIDRYLKGEDLSAGRQIPERIKAQKDVIGIRRKPQAKMPHLSVAQRAGSFKEVEMGLSTEQAVEEASRCLACAGCSECRLCEKACEAAAIDHETVVDKQQTLQVGAVILAPGFELFDAGQKQEFGFGRYPNVISSLQFERILSASGPYQGKTLRPSDGMAPQNMAFVQCVGSRETQHNFCSSVCCMSAIKQAIVAKEHQPELECHIFYIDIRAFGKGFERYYQRAKELGVNFTRCRPSAVKEVPATKNLTVSYYTENQVLMDAEFDLVVLSCGIHPPKSAGSLAQTFAIELNKHGFCRTEPFAPVVTTRPGIYACGTFVAPKDIPETVMEASGASSKAMSLLAEARNTLISKYEYPPEIDIAGQDPRIGVFVCHCGKNIGGIADVPAICDYAKSLPNVVHSQDTIYACSSDTQKNIKENIMAHNLNRIVVASCTPRTHEPLFRNTCREAGLNPYLFEMANIRDQNTWVHMREPEKATQKAMDLVRIAVAKARLLEPLQNRFIEIEHDALVIGGGLSGMTAALELANQGFTTHIVERSGELGGNMKRIHFLLNGGSRPQQELASMVEKASSHPKIKLYTSSNIQSIEGSIGNFKTTLETTNGNVALRHGVVIVATGAKEYQPKEYLYGEDPRVMTQLQFEEELAGFLSNRQTRGRQTEPAIKSFMDMGRIDTVTMVQCVGSRDEERPYCSRICCSTAIKNAIRFKKFKPQAQVYVLYRDVRAYGFNEEYYRTARENGVIFLRYHENEKPEVKRTDGKLSVTVNDQMLKTSVAIETDVVVLSAGVVPDPANVELAQKLKVPLTEDKFFLEAHMKLRPVDFSTDGIFLCGLAHSPKTAGESISQACAAASRAATILAKDRIELDAVVSQVIDENCDGCAYCIDPCPYGALTLIEYMKGGAIKKTVERNAALCKGCGGCQATCPKNGIAVANFKLSQLQAMVDTALESG